MKNMKAVKIIEQICQQNPNPIFIVNIQYKPVFTLQKQTCYKCDTLSKVLNY